MKKYALLLVLVILAICASAQEVNDSVQQAPVTNEDVLKGIQQLQQQINEMSIPNQNTSIDENQLNSLILELQDLKNELNKCKSRTSALEEMNCQQAVDLKFLGDRQFRSFWEGVAGSVLVTTGALVNDGSVSSFLILGGAVFSIASVVNSVTSYRYIRKKRVAVTPSGIIYSF